MNSDQHTTEALRLLNFANGLPSDECTTTIAAAQVHALLAIVSKLERIAYTLETSTFS